MVNFDEIRKWEILELDTGSCDTKSLICVNNKNFEVSYHAAEFIQVVQNSQCIEDVILQYRELGKKITEEDIFKLINKCINPIIKSLNRETKNPFILKLELLSPKYISIISGVLRRLFEMKILIVVVTFIAILEFLFFESATLDSNMKDGIGFYTILGIYLFFIFSSFFHEFGHASACHFLGIKTGGIGFGLYINFPVLYTDVSEVWKLPRKQRFIVNIAGVYFQLIYLIPFIIIYLFTDSLIIKYFIFCVNLNFILTLNPFFKFDGYWIISDMLGIPNLRSRINELFVYIWTKIRRKKISYKPFIFSLPKTYIFFVIIYSLIFNVFFVYYFCYIIPILLYEFCTEFPDILWKFIYQLAIGYPFDFTLFQNIITQLLVIILIIYMIYRTLKPIVLSLIIKLKS